MTKAQKGAGRRNYVQRHPATTSRIMSSIRSTENRVEKALRSELFGLGLRYRKNLRRLPGAPDIVFPREKITVFVDGDFWHGRLYLEEGYWALRRLFKTPNRNYWLAKIRRNVARDLAVDQELRKLGWHVLRWWESDVRVNPTEVANNIHRVVKKRRMLMDSPTKTSPAKSKTSRERRHRR